MRQYLDAVKMILERGTRKPNRTGVDTISTFNVNYAIDLQRGFPLLTTKAINWKNIVVEMLWFLSGRTDIGILKKHGCKFWDAWADDKTGEVPSAYGYFHRRFPAEHRLVAVEPRIVKKPERQEFLRQHFLLQSPKSEKFGIVSFKSALCGEFHVVEDVGRDEEGRSLHDVQFLATGFIAKSIRADVVQAGTIRDPYYPTVCGVGHAGSFELRTDLDHNLYKVWSHMLERCYSSNCKEFELYGAKGVFVCDRWLSFTSFREDCSSLPGWLDKLVNPRSRQIDKDYFGSNCYSKDTCVWITKRDNIRYQSAKAFEVTTPDGDVFIDISRNDVADEFDLSPSCIVDVLEERQEATKGYRFRYVHGVNYRYTFPNDQIRWLIDELKRNPMSRRMVVSAWAPGNAQVSKLPPCHCLFVVNVQNEVVDSLLVELRDTIAKYPSVFSSAASTRAHRIAAFLRGRPTLTQERVASTIDLVDSGLPFPAESRLCLHLTQRSCDIALGVPYNIASYALLMHLLSRFSGIPVGTFGHTLVDAHAYTCKADGSMAEYDHVPGLKEQLSREPRRLPTLEIADSIKSLADVEALLDADTEEVMRHFVLHGYEPHPAINFKVAV